MLKLKKVNWKGLMVDCLFMLVGSLCYGVAISMFSAPNNIAPGGVTGIATLLNYISIHWGMPFEIPIGVATIVMNIPLLIAAWKILGRRLAVRTLLGILFSSVMVDVLDPYFSTLYSGDKANPILVCIFGGVLLGLAVGLIMRRGGTTGGSEIISRLLEKKYPHMSVGNLILLVDAVVISISAVVYGHLENAMYAVIFVFISSQIIDRVVYGGRSGKMVLIMTEKETAVTEAIVTEVNRGCTLLKAQGGYSGADRKMILCTLRRDELHHLRQVTFKIDPHAFLMVLSTDEVRGLGFLHPYQD